MIYIDKFNNIKLTRGDTATLTIELTDLEGFPYIPNPDDTILFGIKLNEWDTSCLKRILIDPITMKLDISKATTNDLDFLTYYYDIKLITADGQTDTFINARKFEVLRQIVIDETEPEPELTEYTGSYEITPAEYDLTLNTTNRYMTDDLVVKGVEPPTGSLSITENGTYDVTDKAEAVVDVNGSMDFDSTIRITNASSLGINVDYIEKLSSGSITRRWKTIAAGESDEFPMILNASYIYVYPTVNSNAANVKLVSTYASTGYNAQRFQTVVTPDLYGVMGLVLSIYNQPTEITVSEAPIWEGTLTVTNGTDEIIYLICPDFGTTANTNYAAATKQIAAGASLTVKAERWLTWFRIYNNTASLKRTAGSGTLNFNYNNNGKNGVMGYLSNATATITIEEDV